MKYVLKFIMISLLFTTAAFAKNNTLPTYNQDKPAVTANAGQSEFVIKLKSNPTTGYSWFLRDYDRNLITPVKHQYQVPTSQLVGAPGYELWTFKVKADGFTVPQVTYIHFVYARPWETLNSTQAVEFKVTTISAPATSHPQKSE